MLSKFPVAETVRGELFMSPPVSQGSGLTGYHRTDELNCRPWTRSLLRDHIGSTLQGLQLHADVSAKSVDPGITNMPYASADFQWWDLEESDLDAHLYNIIAPIQLGERDYDNRWEVFARENPGGAYAWKVSSRYRQLEEAIVALRPIQKLLASPRIPVPTRRGDINRDEWIRMAIDLFLFRFAGIRDHCLHLVNEVFELGLKPIDVRMAKLVNAPQLLQTAVPDALRRVTAVAPDHREERNRRAHEGFQRNYVKAEEALFFKVHAMDEHADGTFSTRFVMKRHDGEDEVYDLAARFEKASAELDREFVPRAEEIVAATKALVAELDQPFIHRYLAKPTIEHAG